MRETRVLPAETVRAALAQMKPRPSLDAYPGDWLRDPISGCSMAANGFWWRAIIVMHDARPYGHLVASNGQPLTEQQSVQRIGCKSVRELRNLLAEVEGVGVPGRTRDADYLKILNHDPIDVRGGSWKLDLSPLAIEQAGVIYSRRMLRDRILSLVRFLVSPRGQVLIPPLSQQTPPFDRDARARSAEDEEGSNRTLGSRDHVGIEGSGEKGAIEARLSELGIATTPSQRTLIGEWERHPGSAAVLRIIADKREKILAADRPFALLAALVAEASKLRAVDAIPSTAAIPEAVPVPEPNPWSEAVAQASQIDASEWLSDSRLIAQGPHELTVGVPSSRHIDEIRERHGADLRRFIPKPTAIQFSVVRWAGATKEAM